METFTCTKNNSLSRFLLCEPRASFWASVNSVFVPGLGGDRVFQSELLLNSVSFSPLWDDFLHKRSLSKFISRDLFYFKKKKSLQIFSLQT